MLLLSASGLLFRAWGLLDKCQRVISLLLVPAASDLPDTKGVSFSKALVSCYSNFNNSLSLFLGADLHLGA